MLADPCTGEVRYVGKTIKTPEARLSGHIRNAKAGKPAHVYCWMRTLSAPPLIVVIESNVPVDELNDEERRWIFVMRMLRVRLTNLTDGGDGGTLAAEPLARMTERLRSPEIRARLATARRGKTASAETRAKQSASQLQRVTAESQEMKARRAAASRGKKASPELRAKLSDAQRRRTPRPPEVGEKISAALRGRKPTPEALENMRAAQQRRWQRDNPISQETRDKLSAVSRGKKRSDEVRAKMSAAQQNRSPEKLVNMSAAQLKRREREKLARNLIIHRITSNFSFARVIAV